MAGKGAPKGNNNAGKNKPWSDALRKALLQSDGKRLRKIAEALLTRAEEGDVAALKELGDRVEGRVLQQIEQSIDQRTEVVGRIELVALGSDGKD